MNKKSSGKGVLIYVIVLVSLVSLAVVLLKQSTRHEAEYSYSEIMQYFDNYQVSEMNFDLGTGELEMIVEGQEKPIFYTVPNVSVFLNEIQTGEENYRREYNKLHPDAPLAMEYYKIQDTSWLYNLLPSPHNRSDAVPVHLYDATGRRRRKDEQFRQGQRQERFG